MGLAGHSNQNSAIQNPYKEIYIENQYTIRNYLFWNRRSAYSPLEQLFVVYSLSFANPNEPHYETRDPPFDDRITVFFKPRNNDKLTSS